MSTNEVVAEARSSALGATVVPPVLQASGLIDEAECEWMWGLLGDGVDHEVFLPAVRRAYTRAMKEGVIRWRMM